MHMKDLMGLSEYAKYRKSRGLPGGTTQSVLNAVNGGRIPTITVGKNRMVNPTAADHAWAMNTDWTRYSPEQIAAMNGEPLPNEPTGPTITPESVQAQAWDLCFRNASIAAAVLVHELEIEPAKALRAAVAAVSTLCLVLAEATENKAYLAGEVPDWAMPLLAGDLEHTGVKRELENVAVFAVELYRPEDEPPADNLPSIADMDRELSAGMAALGVT